MSDDEITTATRIQIGSHLYESYMASILPAHSIALDLRTDDQLTPEELAERRARAAAYEQKAIDQAARFAILDAKVRAVLTEEEYDEWRDLEGGEVWED